MFSTFSGSAMAALGRAQECAADRDGSEISAPDIVLAVLAQQDVADIRSLRSLAGWLRASAGQTSINDVSDGSPANSDPDRLGRLHRSDFTDRIPGQQIPFGESAIAAFRAAWKKAKWDGRKQVDEYDLLTAGIEQPALGAARRATGIDLDGIRAVISGLRQAV